MSAADKIHRRLERGIGSKRSVHVRRADGYSIDGFVLAIGAKWVLLAETSEGGFFNGHIAIRLSAITHVDVDTSFQPRFARTQVEWPPALPADVEDLDLDTTRRMLSTLLVPDRLVALGPEKPVLWIGIPYSRRRRRIALWEVDPKARWAKQPRGHSIGQIMTVRLGSRYLRGLEAIAGPPPARALNSPWAQGRSSSATPS